MKLNSGTLPKRNIEARTQFEIEAERKRSEAKKLSKSPISDDKIYRELPTDAADLKKLAQEGGHGMKNIAPRQGEAKNSMDDSMNDPNIKFTTMLCNTPPSLFMAKMLEFCLNFVIGLTIGYQKSLFFDFFEVTKSYQDQSTLNMAKIPLFFNFLITPFMDIFFSNKIGKCKSYLIVSSVIMSVTWLYLAVIGNDMIKSENVVIAAVIWFLLNLVLNFFQGASDMFALKLAGSKKKKLLSMYQDLGKTSGEFLSYNIYMVICNTEPSIFGKLDEPLMTHRGILLIMGGLTLLLAIYMTFFLAERILESSSSSDNCVVTMNAIPRFCSNTNVRNLLLYVLVSRFFRCIITASLNLKAIEYGLNKSDIANVGTITFPVYLIVTCFCISGKMSGDVMKLNHWMNILTAGTFLIRYFAVADLYVSHNRLRAFMVYAVVNFVERLSTRPIFQSAYINSIAPIAVGTTFTSFFTSWNIMVTTVPSIIGLSMVGSTFQNYSMIALTTSAIQFVMLAITYPYAYRLDRYPKEVYSTVNIVLTSRTRRLINPSPMPRRKKTNPCLRLKMILEIDHQQQNLSLAIINY